MIRQCQPENGDFFLLEPSCAFDQVAAALVRERESAQIALAAKDTELEQLRSALDQARLQGHKVAKENRNLS